MRLSQPKKIISASILSANLAILGDQVTQVLNYGVDWIHIDVMDNHFVPNLSFGPGIVAALRDYKVVAPLDVHLMTKNVDDLIISFAKAGASSITIHPESTSDLKLSLQLIKEHGCIAGIALNPFTSSDFIKYYCDLVDLILIMSVHPGFSGQKFINSSYAKVEEIKSILQELNPNILLGIDGGINQENIGALATSGVDLFVMGNAIFKSNNYAETLAQLRLHIEK